MPAPPSLSTEPKRSVPPRNHPRRATPLWSPMLAIGIVTATAVGSALVLPSVAAIVAPAVILAGLLAVGVAAVARGGLVGERAWLLRLTGVSFALHAVLGVVILHSEWLIRALGPDAISYNQTALELVDHWRGESAMPSGLVAGKSGFVYLLAATYRLFGSRANAGVLVNAALSAAVLPLVWDTTRRLYGQRVARVAALMCLLLPGLLVWGSQLLREALVLFLLALAANAGVRLTERRSSSSIGVLSLAVALLLTVRANVGMLAAGGLVVGVAIGHRRVIVGATVGGLSLAALLVIVLGMGVGYRGYQYVANSDLRDVSETRQNLATNASTGISKHTELSTPSQTLRYLPQGLAALLAGPYPWQTRSSLQASGLVDAAAMWILLPSLWRGCRLSLRREGRQALVLLVPAIFVSLGLSLLVGNVGTAVRERTQVVVLLLPVIAVGWETSRTRRARRRRD